MSNPAVRVEALSKRYRIGKAMARGNGDAKAFGWSSSPFGYLASSLRTPGDDEILWALKDVSFEVAHGEVIGIIGRNGAGKSTLLKVLSRITEPTSGRALLQGRVGSLLEVGTGFHPELTGRENIFLSGAILGMRRSEVARKFDEIAGFAEVDRFLDTPVKRYSSGMYVRLAFAVAAHLETEILLMDEVLAVGDAAFQRKCLGKMGKAATEGRTVLFVSHNLAAIRRLCKRALWIGGGRLLAEGDAREIATRYMSKASDSELERVWPEMNSAPGTEGVRIHRLGVAPGERENGQPIAVETPVTVYAEYWVLLPNVDVHMRWVVSTDDDVVAFMTSSDEEPGYTSRLPLQPGLYRSTCHVPARLLNEGGYRLELQCVQGVRRVAFRMEDVLAFPVIETGARWGAWHGRYPGAVRPQLEWKTSRIGEPPE